MSISEIINLLKSQTVIDNALGGIIASIAMQFINSLFNVNRRFARDIEPETRKAMERAMTLALGETLLWLTDDPIRQRHFAELFERWLLREDVLLELHQLIDPKPGVTLDLELLAAEFAKADWSIDNLDELYTFDEIVRQLAENYTTFAGKEKELQGQIYIQQLREVVAVLKATTVSTTIQTQLNKQILDVLKPDLTPIEQSYLRALYHKCNEIPLARDEQGDPGQHRLPQLQRVYVNLLTESTPSAEQIRQRLIANGMKPQQVEKRLFTYAKAQNLSFAIAEDTKTVEKVRMAGPQTQAKLRKMDSHYWIRSLKNFFTEKQKGLAEALKMKDEDLAELLSPLSPTGGARR